MIVVYLFDLLFLGNIDFVVFYFSFNSFVSFTVIVECTCNLNSEPCFFFVKPDFEIAVYQQTKAHDQHFEGGLEWNFEFGL